MQPVYIIDAEKRSSRIRIVHWHLFALVLQLRPAVCAVDPYLKMFLVTNKQLYESLSPSICPYVWKVQQIYSCFCFCFCFLLFGLLGASYAVYNIGASYAVYAPVRSFGS